MASAVMQYSATELQLPDSLTITILYLYTGGEIFFCYQKNGEEPGYEATLRVDCVIVSAGSYLVAL